MCSGRGIIMSMRLPVPIATLLCCHALAACKHTDPPGNAEPPAFKPAKPRAWIINGQTIPVYGGNTNTGELIGPDASLAGPGMLEEAVGAAPTEPLPTGVGAPTLEGGMLHDGPPASEPQSPFDPALKNPPGTPDTPPPATDNKEGETPKPEETPKPGDPPKPGDLPKPGKH